MIAYGSNFGACKELAERFAERGRFYGYTNDVMTLNELAAAPPRTEPWLLVAMTSTYTSNPPSNANAFRSTLEHGEPGAATWTNCKYVVWGLGNSQWNAFLAFPRYVHARLSELGATPVAEFAYGDVGSPVWEQSARGVEQPRVARAARPVRGATDRGGGRPRRGREGRRGRADERRLQYRDGDVARPARHRATRVLLAPKILTNTVGAETIEVRARACWELQAAESPKRTRHLEVALPPGVAYTAGDHVGVCPKNDEERVERMAGHLGAALDSLFMVPKTLNVRAVPKGTVLQVRNVLTNLVDITGKPTVGPARAPPREGRRPRRALEAGGDQRRRADAGRPGLAAAAGDRRRRVRRAAAARRVSVMQGEHLRVPAGRAAVAAPLLLAELEPARAR